MIQARLASSRLPAKILLDLGGTTALERCLRRVRQFKHVSEAVIATSHLPQDDVIAAVAKRLGARVIRGSETDVLSRFAKAAAETQAEAIVRCTSDCPLLDPAISSSVIERFLAAQPQADYAANVLERKYPRGLDTEIFSRSALDQANRDATASDEREHVTLHLYRRPQTFKLLPVVPSDEVDHSSKRWTLDTLDDYRFLHAVFERLGATADTATMSDVLALLEREPELSALNSHITQKHL